MVSHSDSRRTSSLPGLHRPHKSHLHTGHDQTRRDVRRRGVTQANASSLQYVLSPGDKNMNANPNLTSEQELPGRNSIEVFSTCSQSKDVDKNSYLQNVADVARWSEEAGCKGILVYTDNSIVDPWLVGQIIIQNTERLSPLIAVQPAHLPEYGRGRLCQRSGCHGRLHAARPSLRPVGRIHLNHQTTAGRRRAGQ